MRIILLMLFLCLPSLAEATMTCPSGATCKYVRPANDGNGTTFAYGTSDGSSEANAFEGFADIAGLAAGDTVCLPGGDEPFFERLATGTAGTATQRITYQGCGATQALIWSAQGLSGNRSFDSSRALVTTAPYAWATVATDIYRKQIDVRPRMLWEDSTWLTPQDCNASTEAAVLLALTAGHWCVRDNGDATYRIYYKSTTSTKSPTTTVIRADNVPASGGSPVGIVRVDKDYQTLTNIEVRGHTATSSSRSLNIVDANHIILNTIRLFRNQEGVSVSGDTVATSDVTINTTDVLYSSNTGAYLQGGAFGVTDLTLNGGNYSYSNNSTYNGSGFTAGDGDGIGVGQAGGNITNLTIRHITCRSNVNSCITIATTFAMTVTNVTMSGLDMDGGKYCYGERAGLAQAIGTVVLSGFVCSGTVGGDGNPSMFFGTAPAGVRTVIVANGTFVNNASIARITIRPHVDNNYQFLNLVFSANAGGATTNNGDLYSNGVNLIGDEVFRNISFYSTPNTSSRFARLNAANTGYLYNVGGDLAAFNSATGATGTTVNTDPLLRSATDFRTQAASPLRGAGFATPYCGDVRVRACRTPSDRGGYQATSGDQSTTRTTATTRAPRIPNS